LVLGRPFKPMGFPKPKWRPRSFSLPGQSYASARLPSTPRGQQGEPENRNSDLFNEN
jgi:hypothetical protein